VQNGNRRRVTVEAGGAAELANHRRVETDENARTATFSNHQSLADDRPRDTHAQHCSVAYYMYVLITLVCAHEV